MFTTIYLFELKRWFKNPAFYIYFAIFFGLSYFIMIASLGIFDGMTITMTSASYVNSALNIALQLNSLSMFFYFVLPTIIGASVYRDFRYNVHNFLYSYPITKLSYLLAKFLSGLTIVIIIGVGIVLSLYIAQFQPGINTDLLGPNVIYNYIQPFLYVVIPNIVLLGAIIFVLVTHTRNIYAGVILVLFVFVLQTVLGILSKDIENRQLAALLDPFGFEALNNLSKYWTIDEQNYNSLPLTGELLKNRIIWLIVGIGVFVLYYFIFNFNFQGFVLKKNKQGKRITKNNFGSITQINLTKVTYNFSFFSRLKTAWTLSKFDFKYITKNWTFIIIMAITALMFFLVASSTGQLFGTEIYPVTWDVLGTLANVYAFFLQILIYLFAGMLIQRAKIARMDMLLDSTPIPNWVLLLSKFIALVQMTLFVLFISMLIGISYQLYNGFYRLEISQYITELFGLRMLSCFVSIFFALFIQSFFKNYYVGFFACLLITMFLPLLSKVGLEQRIFKFNSDSGYSYSDMNGYGSIREFIYYRIYWLLFSFVLYGITLLLWKRGTADNFKERFLIAKTRIKPKTVVPIILCLVAYLGLGYKIYYQNNVVHPYKSAYEREKETVDFEKKYSKYKNLVAPRIVSVKLEMNMYPSERNYDAVVRYWAVNKTNQPVDSLIINYSDELQKLDISRKYAIVIKDTVMDIDLYKFDQPLMPNDSIEIVCYMKNKANDFLRDNSPILENGTFMNNFAFPSLGYNDNVEIIDNDIRKKYGLAPKDRMADPRDSTALRNNYISFNSDWIDFEATLSTSMDQIAIAPGYLQKEWEQGGRRYFHYKMDKPILNFYSILSGRYEVLKEKVDGINLEIYYHKGHEFNLDRMMKSMKASLAYYGKEFSPYQFRQMRVIEFPKTHGNFAQAFANTVPFSEGLGFIANVDESNPDKVDYPYAVISHELAHQWWAHQVIGANVKGATMLSESLSEYSSLKLLEKTYGQGQMRKFLKEALDSYLSGRSNENIKENPLMFVENQQYIHYNKGSLVMYAISDFIGESNFNGFLKEYISKVAFQYPPYTTSIEFVNLLKSKTPDSLQYLIKDLFETITLYDNAVDSVTYKKLKDGKYQVDITFRVAKYRSDEKGKRSYEDVKGAQLEQKIAGAKIKSLPLNDFIEIGVFGKQKEKGVFKVENPIYLKKHRINRIGNKVTIIVNEKPVEVGVDPYNKLIDTHSEDNRKSVL